MKPIHAVAGVVLLFALIAPLPVAAQADDPTPPDWPVKLIFIHHSTGENWLNDENGGLGLALAKNNYFVSDTNYGWGPDAIGDRTDIPNWPEWFASENTDRHMQALFDESGQNAPYTRLFDDPGGENEIVLFKSCFPNSALAGSPDDPPTPGYDFTVGNAKFVYNEILPYFASRPDKLFVVITAPPLSDPTYAANARAFNHWLMYDWLRENDYPYGNVAVFDFYNVLTAPDNHHRYRDGAIEHIADRGGDTSYYPSAEGDDHPSIEGNRKATEEFVPLLNIFYRRWQAGAPPDRAEPEATRPSPPTVAPVQVASDVIDDFESGAPLNTPGWQGYRDESTPTTIVCSPTGDSANSGAAALQIEFDVAENSWATCALLYDSPQDWGADGGLAFVFRAERPGMWFDVNIYAGEPETAQTYIFSVETTEENAAGYTPITLTWDQFRRADWEENAGAVFERYAEIVGIAFGLGAGPDAPNAGTIWVDDIQRLGAAPLIAPAPSVASETAPAPAPTEAAQVSPATPAPESARPRMCGGAIAAPLAVVGLAVLNHRRRSKGFPRFFAEIIHFR